MNRIYRLVWNRALRVMQVTSELASPQGGGGGAAGRAVRPGLKPLAVAIALSAAWISGSAHAACTPVNPAPGDVVTCTGAANPLAPSYSSSADDITVVLHSGAGVGVLLGIGGTAMTLGGDNIQLLNDGTIDPGLLGLLGLLSSGVRAGNGNASTLTIQNLTTGVMRGTSGLLGSSLSGVTGMALAAQNGAGGVTTIGNYGSIAGNPLLGVSLVGADIPVVAAYGGARIDFVNAGVITGRVALQAPSTPGVGNSFANAGTINGSVSMGAASSNTFTAVSGSAVNLAGGTGMNLDVLGLAGSPFGFAATGVVDGGAGGNNTLVLQNVLPSAGTGIGTSGAETTVSAGTYINFQHLRINSGTWNILGPLVSQDATLNGGLARVASAGAFGSGTTTANGGAISASVPGVTLANNFALAAGGLLATGDNDFGISGALSGTGGLTKSGAGRLTLTGTNSYTGGTTISAGVLEGNATSLQGHITNNGSLVFNQVIGGTYAGAISGTGGLTKSGAGVLTLTGQHSYTGSTAIHAGTLEVGAGGRLAPTDVSLAAGATLDLSAGGSQSIGLLGGMAGTVDLGGNTLTLTGSANSQFGGVISGSGGLTMNGTGTQLLTGANLYTGGTTVHSGTLLIGPTGSLAAGAPVTMLGGILDLSASGNHVIGQLEGTGGTVQLAASSALFVDGGSFAGSIAGNGGLVKTGTDTLSLDGSNTYTGMTLVQSGRLLVGSDAAHAAASVHSDISVANGASLGGFGNVTGNVVVFDGGHLAAGAPGGVFTVNGNLTLEQGSHLDALFGAPGANLATPGASHSTQVNGDLTLNGVVLNPMDAGGYGPGLYNLFNYTGSLTLGGAGLVAPAAGMIQYLAGSKQINLLNTQGMELNIWNADGLASPTQMGGGSGTWAQANANWTDASAGVTSVRSPSDTFVIFGGAAGTVTVDDVGGTQPVTTQGIQFASDGYQLAGDALGLVAPSVGAPSEVRVGDGSGASAGWSATIDNVLSGNGIRKTGAGTLVLGGANTYVGNTRLAEGTLSVAADANLGAAGNAIEFEGGTLRVTGTAYHDTSRTVMLGTAGGGIDVADAANTFTLAQSLAGTGALTKLGAGTLVLSGNNTYSGGTTVSAGVLEGDTASLQGNITNNASLIFNQAGNGTYAGAISGSGGLSKSGDGTLTLTGTNTYSGGTTVSAGVLEGDVASLQGNITNNASLVFNQAGNGTYAGAISGSGGLTKSGAGTLTLSGQHSYTGGTAINAGTLVVGAGGRLAPTDVSLAAGGSLDLSAGGNQTIGLLGGMGGNVDLGGNTLTLAGAGNGSYAGSLAGAGALVKAGTGTQTLTGATLHTGGTTVNDGTLVIGAGGSLAAGSSMTINGNGVLDVAAAGNQRFATLDGDGGQLRIGGTTLGIGAGSYAGAITGSGGLSKSGAGTLTLSGQNTFTGATTIAQGTLQLGGAAGSTATLQLGGSTGSTATLGGDVTVEVAGTLAGEGTINGNLTNHGMLQPGAIGSVGTLTVNGNFTQGAGGTLAVSLAPDGSGSQLVVNGSATLDGSALLVMPSSAWQPGASYNLLTATGGIDGSFSSVEANFAFVTPTVLYGSNGLGLSLDRNDTAFPVVASTANGRAVAAATEALGAGNLLFDAIVGLDGATAAAAFGQLQADIHAGTHTALLANDRNVRDAVNAHLSGTGSRVNSQESADKHGGSVWASAWGHRGRHDGDGNASALRGNGSGIVFGVDTTVASDARVGAVFGHGQGHARSDVSASARHSGNYAGLYADTRLDRFHLQAGVAYGWQKVTAHRSIAFSGFRSSASARYGASTAQGYLDGSYEFAIGRSTLAPFANIAHDRVRTDAVNERGGAAAVQVTGESTAMTLGTLGARGSFQLDEGGDIRANLSLGWQHAWGELAPSTRMRYAAGDQSFDIAGVPVARNSAVISGGASFRLASGVTVDAAYSGKFASDVKDQGASLVVNWAF